MPPFYKSQVIFNKFGFGNFADMLVELSRREEEENIKADPDIEMYMKVCLRNISKELR